MLIQAPYDELREKMQVVKSLYTSRRYTQCTKVGERLLAETQGEIHPIHLAYLNFYLALSHDTLAREATMKNRHKELSLAENHYMAAIAALTSSTYQASYNKEPPSPTSTISEESPVWRLGRSSNTDSYDATTTSASSSPPFSDSPDAQFLDLNQTLGNYTFPRPQSRTSSQRGYAPQRNMFTVTASRPQTPEEYQIAADTTSFICMIRSHLVGVQELKDKSNVPSVRFTCSPQISPITSKPRSSHLFDDKDGVRESILESRRRVQWRPRFDPSSVQQLCNEALAELC